MIARIGDIRRSTRTAKSGASTACQSGSSNVPLLSIVVTNGLGVTAAGIDTRCPAASMNAIFVPSGEYVGSFPATLRFCGDTPPAGLTANSWFADS